MTQRDLFHDDEGRDTGRPLPDEDLEATGFSQDDYCNECAHHGGCNVILKPGERCTDRAANDIDQETAEIEAIEKDLETTGFSATPKQINAGIDKLNALTKDQARELDRQLSRSGTQGKCLTCKECFRWHSRRPLKLAYCPQCGAKLVPTTHLNRWPWTVGIEPLTAVQAWAKFRNTK